MADRAASPHPVPGTQLPDLEGQMQTAGNQQESQGVDGGVIGEGRRLLQADGQQIDQKHQGFREGHQANGEKSRRQIAQESQSLSQEKHQHFSKAEKPCSAMPAPESQ